LRPLPLREPNRLLVAWKDLGAARAAHWPFQAAELDVLARESQVLESVAGISYYDPAPFIAKEQGAASYVNGAAVTGEFFDVIGVAPLLGRTLNHADAVGGAENVLVITHRLWQRRYGGSADVLGRKLGVNEQSFTIVGVMP